MIEVLELDQWTASGNIRELSFDELTLAAIQGGDSDAAKIIFGGTLKRRIVSESDIPRMGTVWFTRASNGTCQFHSARYDTSD